MALRAILVAIATIELCSGLTCFLSETTTIPRVGYGSLRTDVKEDCETACEADAMCISFVYSDAQALCVFQNADVVHPQILACATTSYVRWVKTTSGCPTTTTPSTTTTCPPVPILDGVGDPCILQASPELTTMVAEQPPCPRRHPDGRDGPPFIVRLKQADGTMITVENSRFVESGCTRSLIMGLKKRISASLGYVCATHDDTACPCASAAPPQPSGTCSPSPAPNTIFACPSKLRYLDYFNSNTTVNSVPGSAMHIACTEASFIRYDTTPPYLPRKVASACCAP